MMKLEKPNLKHIEMYHNYIEEWTTNLEDLIPSSVRLQDMSFEEWVDFIKTAENKESCSIEFVPANTYFLVKDENYIIGAINIRHELNESLRNIGGHIGYGIRPTERRKGYARELLKMGLEESKKMGLKEVLVTCDKKNIGSSRTIISNGGVLENEVEGKERTTQRYWIKL